MHYRTVPGRATARDGVVLALAEMAACAPRLDAQIAVDSALSLGRITSDDLWVLRGMLGASRRRIADEADAGCQSGTETIVRLLLRGRRLPHRTQAWIPGVGYVDVLVGDRLVIEIDGEGFHTGSEFERDRRRDFELTMRGYLVFRLSYSMVMHEWAAVREGRVRRMTGIERFPWRAWGVSSCELASSTRPARGYAASQAVVSPGSVRPSRSALARITSPAGSSTGSLPVFATTSTLPLRTARTPSPRPSIHSSSPVASERARRSASSDRYSSSVEPATPRWRSRANSAHWPGCGSHVVSVGPKP
ncbi:DUF559 domain-containing protein [Agromyces sp. Q22]|uniref:DUF559 domain-containing protein n=1 Tax=Agromyces kandeliae TaxID=2666141 RepID=A0A6L5QZW4_9MICO|nr:DUF559 domain-containing protein [Agromyces kandeliae]